MMCSTTASLSWTTNAFPVGDQLRAELNSESEAHSMVWYNLKGKVCFTGSIVDCFCVVLVWLDSIDEKGFYEDGRWRIAAPTTGEKK